MTSKYFEETVKAADDLTNALGSVNGPDVPAMLKAAAKLDRYWLAGQPRAMDYLKLFHLDMKRLGLGGYILKHIEDSIGREA